MGLMCHIVGPRLIYAFRKFIIYGKILSGLQLCLIALMIQKVTSKRYFDLHMFCPGSSSFSGKPVIWTFNIFSATPLKQLGFPCNELVGSLPAHKIAIA